MRKLIVACPCGQRMQVARSAYGKTGVCPKCGQKIRVGATGVEPLALPSPGTSQQDAAPAVQTQQRPSPFSQRPERFTGRTMETEQSKVRFGQAVDLFYRGQYAEALVIFEALLREHPANPQIGTARSMCQQALVSSRPALPETSAVPAPEPPAERSPEPEPLEPPKEQEPVEELTLDAVRRTVLHLLSHGTPDSVRLQAAELALRLLEEEDSEVKPGNLFVSRCRGKATNKPTAGDNLSEPAAAVR